MKASQGFISGIERFAIHDGPGIRSLVFMKGCPLRCLWCSSPQTQNPFPEVLYDAAKCRSCGTCACACSAQAMSLSEEGGVSINKTQCTGCGACVAACPNQALELAGKSVSPEELFNEIHKDSSFHRRSGGGVTVGGGEPTMQHEFATKFLRKAQQLYVHTAIETCGYVRRERLEMLLQHVDLVYFDLKHMDALAHKELTGVSNKRILGNARLVSSSNPLVIRIPVVPGCNDSDENILATGRFAAGLGRNLQWVELLPYHKIGAQTYRRLGRQYELGDVEPPDEGTMIRLKGIVESCGVKAQIGA